MPVVRAAVHKHLHELGVVADGGDEARAAGLERGVLAVGVQPEVPVGVVEAFARVVAVVVGGGEAGSLVGGDDESGVLHAERAEDLVLKVLPEAFPGGDLDDRAHHVGGVAVRPAVAGFEREAAAAELVRELDRGELDALLAEVLHLAHDLGDVRRAVGIEQPGGHVQQVGDVHRAVADDGEALSVLGVVALVRESRQVARDHGAGRQDAAVDVHDGGGPCDRLRLRIDAEDGVAGDLSPGFDVGIAAFRVVNLLAFVNDHDGRAGVFAAVDGFVEQIGEAVEFGIHAVSPEEYGK